MRFHVRAGATKGNAADDFLAKVHDSDLVKTAGYINGQWVAATDGSTIEASPTWGSSDLYSMPWRTSLYSVCLHAICKPYMTCPLTTGLLSLLLRIFMKPYLSKDGPPWRAKLWIAV